MPSEHEKNRYLLYSKMLLFRKIGLIRRNWLFCSCLGLVLVFSALTSCADKAEKKVLADMRHQIQFLDSTFEIQSYDFLKMWAKRNGRYSGDEAVYLLADSLEKIYRSEKATFDARSEKSGVAEIIDRYKLAFAKLTEPVIGRRRMLPADEQELIKYKVALDSLKDYEEDAVCLFAQFNLAMLRYKIMSGMATGCHLSSHKCFLYSFAYAENDTALIIRNNNAVKLPDAMSFLCLDEVKLNGKPIPFNVKYPYDLHGWMNDTVVTYSSHEVEDLGYFRKRDLDNEKSYYFRTWLTIEKPTGDKDFFLVEKTISEKR